MLYAAKVATIGYVRARAQAEPERVTVLYEDEVTYYRRPTVAQGYAVLRPVLSRAGAATPNDGSRPASMCRPASSSVGNERILMCRC